MCGGSVGWPCRSCAVSLWYAKSYVLSAGDTPTPAKRRGGERERVAFVWDGAFRDAPHQAASRKLAFPALEEFALPQDAVVARRAYKMVPSCSANLVSVENWGNACSRISECSNRWLLRCSIMAANVALQGTQEVDASTLLAAASGRSLRW